MAYMAHESPREKYALALFITYCRDHDIGGDTFSPLERLHEIGYGVRHMEDGNIALVPWNDATTPVFQTEN